MVISKLKPGMTVYEIRAATGTMKLFRRWLTYPVYIKQVDETEGIVYASWNGTEISRFTEYRWAKWRMQPPKD